MLWTGDTPKAKELEENMASYFNVLQGFLLYFYGSMVGAGPTLSSSLHQLVMQVVNSSFNLMKDTISSYSKSHSHFISLSLAQISWIHKLLWIFEWQHYVTAT